jgi:hypothetical protein
MQSEMAGVRTDATGTIAGHALRYRLSHLVVRVVATVNIAHLLLLGYRPYFRAANHFLGWIDIKWMIASSLLLPLYVGFETWWMFGAEPSQKKPLLIDWVVAVIWLVMWWAFVLYSLYLYFPMI